MIPSRPPSALRLLAAALGVLLLCYVRQLLLLVFAACLLAVPLRAAVSALLRHSAWGPRRALAVVVIGILLLVGGFGALLGTRIAAEFDQLAHTMQTQTHRAHLAFEQSDTGRSLLQLGSRTEAGESLKPVTGAATDVLRALTDAAIILFVGVFLAADPQLYRRGFLVLLPVPWQARAAGTLDAIGAALLRWLLGVLIAAICIGAITTAGLLLLGVPLALSLGLLAGLTEFIPYVGPLLSAVPATLVGFALGPEHALEVVGLFVVVHVMEGYVIVPLVQKWAVALPPATGIVSVVLFGMLFGPLGIVLSHPLMVTLIVLVQQLYLRPRA